MRLHWLIRMQTILEAADQLIFIIKEKQFKGSVEGSIPVLIKSVSSVPNILLNGDEQVLLKRRELSSFSLFTSQVNWLETAEEIDDLFLGDAEVKSNHVLPFSGIKLFSLLANPRCLQKTKIGYISRAK